MIVKYKVLMTVVRESTVKEDLERFEGYINTSIGSGWEPLGGVAMHWNGQDIQLAQAVVLNSGT